MVAGLVVFVTQIPEKQVDFMPGGGSQQGAAASADLQHKVQQKKQNKLTKTMPLKRLVSTSSDTSIRLPDAPWTL